MFDPNKCRTYAFIHSLERYICENRVPKINIIDYKYFMEMTETRSPDFSQFVFALRLVWLERYELAHDFNICQELLSLKWKMWLLHQYELCFQRRSIFSSKQMLTYFRWNSLATRNYLLPSDVPFCECKRSENVYSNTMKHYECTYVHYLHYEFFNYYLLIPLSSSI